MRTLAVMHDLLGDILCLERQHDARDLLHPCSTFGGKHRRCVGSERENFRGVAANRVREDYGSKRAVLITGPIDPRNLSGMSRT